MFINSGCKFQDQGGIFIDDDALIGHNATLCTLNHNPDPLHRGDMTAKSIHIGNRVWLGANVTILQGVTIEENAIVAAGAVVADKMIGKAAAALMAVGGVKQVHTNLICTPAREMMEKAGVQVTAAEESSPPSHKKKIRGLLDL